MKPSRYLCLARLAILASPALAVGPPLPPVTTPTPGSGPVTTITRGKLATDLDANEKSLIKLDYLNFGTLKGFAGYGLRDNSGTLEYKNNAGSWAVLGSGGGGGGDGTVTSIGVTPATGSGAGITVADSPVTTSGNITLGINWATITPAAVSATSTNTATGTAHSHEVTASSNPGSSVSLLKTGTGGLLQLKQLTISDYLSSAEYVDGQMGFRLDGATGNAAFTNVDVWGAIHASVIVYGQVQATAGTILTTKSAAKLRTDLTIPASPTYGTTTVNVDVVDADGLSHGSSQLFVVGDVLYLQDGFVGATWLKVASVSNQSTFWRYVCTIRAGTNNVSYHAGIGVADYGGTGAGFIVQTADRTHAPYLMMATHQAAFTAENSGGTLAMTQLLRLGNLNGSYDYSSDTYGLAAGDYDSGFWMGVDNVNGLRLRSYNGGVDLDAAGLKMNSAITPSAYSSLSWYPGVGNEAYRTGYVGNTYSGTTSTARVAAFPKSTDTTNGIAIAALETRKPGGDFLSTLGLTGQFRLTADRATAKTWAYLNKGDAESPDYTFDGLAVGSNTHPSHMLEITGTGKFTGLLTVAGSTPASSSATCEAGVITWDSSYIYVCIATNTWKRVAISTW